MHKRGNQLLNGGFIPAAATGTRLHNNASFALSIRFAASFTLRGLLALGRSGLWHSLNSLQFRWEAKRKMIVESLLLLLQSIWQNSSRVKS
jgi:hypothetical protein